MVSQARLESCDRNCHRHGRRARSWLHTIGLVIWSLAVVAIVSLVLIAPRHVRGDDGLQIPEAYRSQRAPGDPTPLDPTPTPVPSATPSPAPAPTPVPVPIASPESDQIVPPAAPRSVPLSASSGQIRLSVNRPYSASSSSSPGAFGDLRQAPQLAATPRDASCVLHFPLMGTMGALLRAGSGTILATSNGKTWILTASHILDDDDKRTSFVAVVGDRRVPAKLVKRDRKHDLMLLEASEQLPGARLAPSLPSSGDTVASFGAIGRDSPHAIEWTHSVIGVYSDNDSKFILTNGQQIEGRSGGGLFFHGNLVGVIKARLTNQNQSIYVSLPIIREFLGEVGTDGLVGDPPGDRPSLYANSGQSATIPPEAIEVEFWSAPFACPPCNQTCRAFGRDPHKWKEGETLTLLEGSLKVTKRIGPAPWMTAGWLKANESNGYPFYAFPGVGGRQEILHGATTPELLLKSIRDRLGESYSSAPAIMGVLQIQNGAKIKSSIAWLRDWAGPDSTFRLLVVRRGGKECLRPNDRPIRSDLLGDHGRIELQIETSKDIPIRAVSFNYRYEGGKAFIDPDEFEVEFSDGEVMSASQGDRQLFSGPDPGQLAANNQKQGCVIIAALSILSWAFDFYALVHPDMTLWPGERWDITAKLDDSRLTIDLGDTPPEIHVDWHFFFGLADITYRRAVTGAVVDTDRDEVILQFHKSYVYRDMRIPIIP